MADGRWKMAKPQCFHICHLPSHIRPPFCRGRDASSPGAPRTDPYVQDCCIRLLPWMHSVEAYVRMRVHDAGAGDPRIDESQKPHPGQPPTLPAAPQRPIPAPDDLSPKAVQTIHVAGHRVVVEIA